MTWTFRSVRGKRGDGFPEEPVPGAQWWTAGPGRPPERALGAGVAVLPVALGAATSALGLMLLPVLVAAVALGSADYGRGRTGAVGPAQLAVVGSAACALCLAAGSWLTGHLLRRAAVERRAACRTAGLTGSVLAVLLVLNGLLAGRAAPAAVAGLLFAGLAGAWLGALAGVGRRPPRVTRTGGG